MQAQIRLGRIFGIEIGLHYSWLIIAVLIATSLARHFSEAYPDWAATIIWTTAIMTALLFFAAIIFHELSHAAIARLRGLPVRSITLFALGGVAQIGKKAADAMTEFWMGIVGPLTSALIGALCLGIAWTLGWTFAGEPSTPVTAMLVWLGYINFGLAIFNMVPGFPMDGGRVLRGVIWWITGNAAKANRAAAATGQVIAYGFIFLGILRFFGGAGFSGLWIAFIGGFFSVRPRKYCPSGSHRNVPWRSSCRFNDARLHSGRWQHQPADFCSRIPPAYGTPVFSGRRKG